MMLAGRTIFILEDELIIAFALEDMLADMGAEVLMASTLEEGLAHAAKDEIALAILDVNVAGHKSYPVAEALRGRGVPIVFATGYGDAEHPPEFAATPTLTKPYNKQQLMHAIEALL